MNALKMRPLARSIMLLLTLLCARAPQLHAQSQAQAADELQILQVKDSTIGTTVHPKQKIIVWTSDKTRSKGYVTQIKADSVTLDSVQIPLAKIEKIKAFDAEMGTERMNRWARTCAWIALGAVGLVLLGVIVAFALGQLAIGILIMILGAVVAGLSLLILLGTIIALIGANIPATTFKIGKLWRMKQVMRGKH